MKKTILRKYARLAVRKGVNLKKGQGCAIYAQVEQHEFAEMVAEEAYRAGAKWVQVFWQDQAVRKLDLRHQTVTQLSRVEEWEKVQQQMFVDQLPARIHISSEDPDGLKGVSVPKMQKAQAARSTVLRPYRKAIDNKHQWTIIAVPSKKWAKKVFPGVRASVAEEKLWEAILQTVRVTPDNDPEAAWDQHNATLQEKSGKLNALDLDYLHYTAPNGTDFKCWLIPGAKWEGGGATILDGTFYNPNMPTEEVFTSPLKGKCEGTLVSTMPLSYQGNLIDQFSITFENGRAVSCKAQQGQELLEKMLHMDEGASMLGELALVPHDSPVSNTGILFYNTLFDENAACHVALGFGFPECVEGFESMTDQELQEKGVNDSIIHVDFMIGSKDLDITGYTRDGKAVQIFKNGNWAI
ncbi:MAG TPA: aminopeptidase [Candidatus Acutalibacter stercorigallinarum]|nr:aminopeptidase [Candidatus Acutalibacter stercorigallinarum]